MTQKKFRLSRKRQKWAKQFKPTSVVRGGALNYPVGIEIQFRRDSIKLIRDVMKKTEEEVRRIYSTPEAKTYFATDYMFAEDAGIAATANEAFEKFIAFISEMVRRRAKAISERMVRDTNKRSQASMSASLKELSGGVTLKTSELGGDIPDRLRAAINVNVDLMAATNAAYLAKVSDAVNRSIMVGRGLQDLIPFFAKQRGISERHAKNVALDQTRKAYTSLNEARMKSVGLSKFEWLHSGGGQVPRKFHIDRFPKGLNGGIYDINDPPVIDPKTGEKGLPSQLPNCFPGDSKVDLFFGALKVFRHFYTGETTEFVTANGRVVRCTPNHPILSDRGFKRAQFLDVGDNIVGVLQQGSDAIEGYRQGPDIEFSELFDSLGLLVGFESSRGTGTEFHGDITDEKIDIIGMEWGLWDGVESGELKSFFELILSVPHMGIDCGISDGPLFSLIQGLTSAPGSIVRRACQLASLGPGHARHPDVSSIASASGLDSVLLHDSIDRGSRHVQIFRDLLQADPCIPSNRYRFNRYLLAGIRQCFGTCDSESPGAKSFAKVVGVAGELAGGIHQVSPAAYEFDRIIEKRVSVFSSHVYNLEMVNGLYFVGSIAVSNCKCRMRPVLVMDDGTIL